MTFAVSHDPAERILQLLRCAPKGAVREYRIR